jgi:hypothetical protein
MNNKRKKMNKTRIPGLKKKKLIVIGELTEGSLCQPFQMRGRSTCGT